MNPNKIPKNYKCGISLMVMAEPVIMTTCGHTFEKELLLAHYKRSHTCPTCRGPIQEPFAPNISLRNLIQDFLHNNPEQYDENEVYLPKVWVEEYLQATIDDKPAIFGKIIERDPRLLKYSPKQLQDEGLIHSLKEEAVSLLPIQYALQEHAFLTARYILQKLDLMSIAEYLRSIASDEWQPNRLQLFFLAAAIDDVEATKEYQDVGIESKTARDQTALQLAQALQNTKIEELLLAQSHDNQSNIGPEDCKLDVTEKTNEFDDGGQPPASGAEKKSKYSTSVFSSCTSFFEPETDHPSSECGKQDREKHPDIYNGICRESIKTPLLPYMLKKIAVVGTSNSFHEDLLARIQDNSFPHSTRLIGVDFCIKTIPHIQEQNGFLKLQFWFISSQERFRSINTAYYRGVETVILCWTGTSEDKQEVRLLSEEAKKYSKTGTPLILVNTHAAHQEDAEKLAKEIGAYSYLYCSAQNEIGFDELFFNIQVLSNYPIAHTRKSLLTILTNVIRNHANELKDSSSLFSRGRKKGSEKINKALEQKEKNGNAISENDYLPPKDFEAVRETINNFLDYHQPGVIDSISIRQAIQNNQILEQLIEQTIRIFTEQKVNEDKVTYAGSPNYRR